MADPASSDDLYGVDPAEFVAARDRLARSLRADGQRDEAARIAKLRRPPQSTWALNLLARREPELIDEVLRAATALRDALAAAGGDNGAEDRRTAQAAYRDAIDAAVAAAAAEADVTAEDMRTRMRTNLLAAGVDEDLALRLQHGTLPDDQEAPGFGGTPTIGPIAPRAPRPASRAKGTARRAKAVEAADAPDAPAGKPDRAAARAQQRVDDAARAQQQVDELERRRVARQRAELGREVERLDKKAARLQAQAEAAEERAATARGAADRATEAATEAADRLREL